MSELYSTTESWDLFVGAGMWNSAFDAHSNMEPAIWPNAAAVAEQLWSPSIQSDDDARTRLSQHRCRTFLRVTSLELYTVTVWFVWNSPYFQVVQQK